MQTGSKLRKQKGSCGMYLNKTKTTAAGIKYTVLTVIGVLGILFFTVGGTAVTVRDRSFSDLLFVLGFSAVCIPMFLSGVRGGRVLRRAAAYNVAFEGSKDNKCTVPELKARMGMSEEKILSELRQISDKAYFANCTLSMDGPVPYMLLLNRPEPEQPKYVDVICSSCGAKAVLLAGTTGKCEYCGTPIREKAGKHSS